jgi:predicted protein tyrosine phosphatase
MGLLKRAIDLLSSAARIEVLGEDELVRSLESGARHYSHCISIADPAGLPWLGRLGVRVPAVVRSSFRGLLRLEFVDDEREAQMGKTSPARVARRSDVRRAIRFYRRTEARATGYTLHCWQGISRSPAFALGLLYLMTGSERAAARILRLIRPDALPHPGIVRLFDQELGSNLLAVNREIRGLRTRELRQNVDQMSERLLALPAATGL